VLVSCKTLWYLYHFDCRTLKIIYEVNNMVFDLGRLLLRSHGVKTCVEQGCDYEKGLKN
jgi:hypothetical protein